MAVRLGRVAGVEVRVHVSVLVVFALVTWALATGTLPLAAEGSSAPARWVAAFVGAVLFFGSLLAHETAHAVVAKRHGIGVRSLTLWLLGGVAELDGTPASPGVEARVAVVGPLTSVGIAVVAGGAAAVLSVAGAPDVVVAVAWWLAVVNGVLAAFNLLPAFPMDGGRLLHAALWRRWHDRSRATATAAATGRMFGVMLLVFGVLETLAGSAGGLWLVMVGWFVALAGRAEATATETEMHLRGVPVRDVMTADPVVVPAWCTVADFVERYAALQRHPVFPVADLDGAPFGVLTLDAVRRVPLAARPVTAVRRVAVPMTRVVVAHPDEPVVEVLHRMARGPAVAAVVVDGGRVTGVLAALDVVHAEQLASLGAPLRSLTFSDVPEIPIERGDLQGTRGARAVT